MGLFLGESFIKLSNNSHYFQTRLNETGEPTSTLKFGDRIDNKATVVGTFESSDLGTVVYAVLDSTYYTKTAWASGLYTFNTGLPNYNSSNAALNAKESATYNTDYILNNYSDKATEAFTFCRNVGDLSFNGKTYKCQLPNAYEVQQIYENRVKLYELDPTTSTNTSFNLANWKFNGSIYLWSSNESNAGNSWPLHSDGSFYGCMKKDTYGVIPIIEIPIQK